ncbi:MAG: hypothetical protein GC162_02330 [Planctomycetes bacterium]|nr:hypothetical protein [Planctomycetota bacterium]
MARHRGFTLTDLVAVLAVAAVMFALLSPFHPVLRSVSRREICQLHLSSLYKAMYTYSITDEKQRFPMVGSEAIPPRAIGFREGDRRTGKGATLDGNATASLWLLIRNGSTATKEMVCPSTMDMPDEMMDRFDNTHDFLARKNLSFSMMNMYHVATGWQWSADVKPDWVLMADNNANDHPDRHRSDFNDRGDADRMAQLENSPNHRGEGQNFLFGDGHVSFEMDPFVGPDHDNVFALTVGGLDAPPDLSDDAGDAARDRKIAKSDVMLIPLSGNGGGAGSLSGHVMDVQFVPYKPDEPDHQLDWFVASALGIGCLIWVVRRQRAASPSSTAAADGPTPPTSEHHS